MAKTNGIHFAKNPTLSVGFCLVLIMLFMLHKSMNANCFKICF